MPQSIKKRLESMFSHLRSTLEGDESILEALEVGYKRLISEFNSEAITYCLKNYIKAELDYTTPGSRGIGRITANIPRFGAYFRKPLSKLSIKELNKLDFLIQDLCLRGYLDSAIYVKWPANNAKLSDEYLLFRKWIACIYVVNPFGFSPELWGIIKADIAFTIIEIHDFMRKHGIEVYSLFKRAGKFLPGDRVNEIFDYYAIAGYTLRAVEEGYY